MLHQSYTDSAISDECAEMLISNLFAYSVVYSHNCETSKNAVIFAFLDIALFSAYLLSGGGGTVTLFVMKKKAILILNELRIAILLWLLFTL